MSNTPPDPPSSPQPDRARRRMLTGLICFGGGLLLVASAVVFVLVQLVESNPVALIPGILVALIGIAVNFTGLVLIYRAITGTTPKDRSERDDTP
ncbi:hypothetical protein [Mycetocola zhujimingii]|nr:hypothetical protein [Mycetocola zhujimingii]